MNPSVELRAEALGYAVPARRILAEITLSIGAGELVGLVGPNGAGKSTLLRVLDRVLRPTSGRVLLDGRPLDSFGSRELARRLTFMSPDMQPVFDLAVLDVVLLGRYAHTRRLEALSEGDRERAREALGTVGLEGFDERPFHELSTGERHLVLLPASSFRRPPRSCSTSRRRTSTSPTGSASLPSLRRPPPTAARWWQRSTT